ncbi:MAG: glycosyltransferase family 2 protein [Crenarchaeota archaeon]|nr:glycosyltransferase family 2 protein [Thermoproteota archaeon]
MVVLKHAKKPLPTELHKTSPYVPMVSILVPAHNEGQVLEKLLQSLTCLTYPKNKLEVIIINDASNDQTQHIADNFSSNYSYMYALHRFPPIGGVGKAAALNDGLNYSIGEIVLCFDADYLPCRDIVEKLVKEFVNPVVGAVQGRPVVQNESQSFITRIITLERIGGYRVDQEARNLLKLIPQFGGTVGGFRRSILFDLGGFDEKMLTEDTDLTFHIYLKGYKIRYAGDAECYEEAVKTLKTYWRQRHRWARGHMQVCCKHAFNVVRSKYLTKKEKIDGLLLLHIYFVPVLTLFASVNGIILWLFGFLPISNALVLFLPLTLYSIAGNFAPFFEIGIGTYLDGRKQLHWLSPLLFFAFLYNMLICTKAFFDVFGGLLFGRAQTNWAKTEHLGYGTKYFPITKKEK